MIAMAQRMLEWEIDCGFCLWAPLAPLAYMLGWLAMALRMSPGCCCTSLECAACDSGTVPNQIQLVVANFVNATCSYCSRANGTFVLDWVCEGNTNQCGYWNTWGTADVCNNAQKACALPTPCSANKTAPFWFLKLEPNGPFFVRSTLIGVVSDISCSNTTAATKADHDTDCSSWVSDSLSTSSGLGGSCSGGYTWQVTSL